MNEIDWSKAPEGYPVWVEDLMHGEKSHGWHKESDGRWVDQLGRYWEKSAAERGNCRAHYRPEPTPSWSGDGLPPVGVVCEVKQTARGAEQEWFKAEVLYSSHYTVVLDDYQAGEFVSHPCTLQFRPIRTPEQIAADEQETATDVMFARFGGVAGLTRKQCAWVISEGYRKP